MNILKDIFLDLATLQEFVPGVPSDTKLSELNSSANSAIKQIKNVITPDIFIQIQNDIDSDIRNYLLSAIGNLTLHKASIFEIIARRLSGKETEVYKSEREAMERHYIDNYFNAMDSIFQELESGEKYKDEWQKTSYFRSKEKLQIKTTGDFNSLYGIDMSYLFFFRTIYIQEEVLDESFADYFERIKTRREFLEKKLMRALAQMVVAIAVTRFDIVELPATIRSLFIEQKAVRNGVNEHSVMKELSASLITKAMDTIKAIDTALSESSGDNIESGTSVNRPEDKEFLMA